MSDIKPASSPIMFAYLELNIFPSAPWNIFCWKCDIIAIAKKKYATVIMNIDAPLAYLFLPKKI